MNDISLHLRTTWVIFATHLKQMAVDSFVIFTVIVQPLIVGLLAIYMLRDQAGFQAIYVIVGSGLTGLWSGTAYLSARGVESERWAGTLEEIIGSPTHLVTVVIGKALAQTVLSLCSMVITYPIAAFFFGYSLTISDPFGFLISLVLTITGFISIALVIAPVFSMNPGTAVWSNPLEFSVFALSGFLFPVLLLPPWLSPISYVLAPYWAARALHATSSGGLAPDGLYMSWGLVLTFSALYWILSARLFRILLHRARVDATLGFE